MHEQMRARVLVVPSKHFTKVRPDGSFRLEGVPAGRRKLVAWGPNLKPAQHTVDVVTGGVQAQTSPCRPPRPRCCPTRSGRRTARTNSPGADRVQCAEWSRSDDVVMRRRLTGLALLALGGAAAALAVAQVGLAPADDGPLKAVAQTLRGDLQARLKTQLEALTDASRAAATLPRLKAALAAKVDAPHHGGPVLQRELVAPVPGGVPHQPDDHRQGRRHPRQLRDRAARIGSWSQTARRQGYSAAVLGVKGKPYLVTAARVGPAFGDDAPVILLARPADSGWLEQVAAPLQAGLMLTDGQAPLFMAGAGALRAVLPGLAAAPAAGEAPMLDPEGRWSAIRHELGPGLHLWAVRAVAGPLPARGGVPPGLWWLAAGLAVVLGLVQFAAQAGGHRDHPGVLANAYRAGGRAARRHDGNDHRNDHRNDH